MGEMTKSLYEIHQEVFEDLELNGYIKTSDELSTIRDRVDNEYQTVKDYCGKEHKLLVHNIFVLISKYQGV
jgi:hypothetical protein